MHLHQFRRQIVGIVSFEIAGKHATLIDLAQPKIRFSHKEKSRARVRLLAKNFLQIFDRKFQIAGFSNLHFNARAQNDRLPIFRIIF